MNGLRILLDRRRLAQLVDELEELDEKECAASAAALLVLKNELEPLPPGAPARQVLYEQHFALPGTLMERLEEWHGRQEELPTRVAVGRIRNTFRRWLRGDDTAEFRDRCDAAFWRRVVPPVEEHFGSLAGPVLNTVNEAIINYAEYSFAPGCLGRAVQLHLFLTEGELAYAIVRPRGTALRPFDPLALHRRDPGALRRRGWGHTLIVERALFISFDREPHRRGMMIVIGPEG